MNERSCAVPLFLLLIALTGCNAVNPGKIRYYLSQHFPGLFPPLIQVCTLLGAPDVDSLWVEFEGNHPDSFKITFADTHKRTISFQCQHGDLVGDLLTFSYLVTGTKPDARATCRSDGAALHDYLPYPVTITVEWEDERVSRKFWPDYEEYAPNGKGCPPEWVEATIAMELAP